MFGLFYLDTKITLEQQIYWHKGFIGKEDGVRWVKVGEKGLLEDFIFKDNFRIS